MGLILVFHQRTRCLEQAQVLIAEVHLRHDHTIHAHPRTTQRPPAFRWFKIWSSPVSCLTTPISYLYLHCFPIRLVRSFRFFNISTVLPAAWCGPFFFFLSSMYFSALVPCFRGLILRRVDFVFRPPQQNNTAYF